MREYNDELQLAKFAVITALEVLRNLKPSHGLFEVDAEVPREMKAEPDKILEDVILRYLIPTKLNVLSEELGLISQSPIEKLHWIVDPLDGTVNFIRGLSSCSISIALYMGSKPIFGVIGEFPSGKLFWGGSKFGSYDGDMQIYVSAISSKSQSVICSGFPSRFQFSHSDLVWISNNLAAYAKVRMLGSASISLVQVARGAAEAYSERNIMLWDVAAGLAIIQGAGGSYVLEPLETAYSLNVYASNGKISEN